MAFLQKWYPSHEVERFRHEIDDLLQHFGSQLHWIKEWESMPMRPPVEVFADGDNFTIRIDLPGVDPNNVDVKVAGGSVTVTGHREEKRDNRNAHYYRHETHYGSFARTIQLPEGVQAESLKATYRAGVLELTAKLSPEAAPKEIKIQVETAEKRKTQPSTRAA